MPVSQTTETNVSCDNPSCPGHPDLDPTSVTGWILVTHELYGEASSSHVFGSYDCLSQASQGVADGTVNRETMKQIG